MTNRLDEVMDTDTGLTLRSLTTVAECEDAIWRLQKHIDKIVAQIARAEEDPSFTRPGWRTRAQSALRWKNRSIKAIKAHALALHTAALPPRQRRQAAILKTIHAEMGDVEFERLVQIAKAENPELFVGEGP